MRIKGIILSV